MSVRTILLVLVCVALGVRPALVQSPSKPQVIKLANGTYRVGPLRVDTTKREVTVAGHINDVTILEFVANTKDGQKAYESLITIDTDAVTFNTALLLIGLDPARARVPTRHFDPEPPRGDPVDIFVDLTVPMPRRVRVEQLLYDQRTKTTMPEGPWVYTGSTFVNTGSQRRYLADVEGVLIGFVHSPAPVIENPRQGGVDAYGSIVMNANFGPIGKSPVTLTIKALERR